MGRLALEQTPRMFPDALAPPPIFGPGEKFVKNFTKFLPLFSAHCFIPCALAAAWFAVRLPDAPFFV